MLQEDKDCEKINLKYDAQMSLVFFNSLELMPSAPDDDESFSFSIIAVMPCSVNSIGDITDCTADGGIGNRASGSVVNTDENARLNASAHSSSGITISLWSAIVIAFGGLGFSNCQNFWG